MAEQRREYFRLEYPYSYRPRLLVADESFEVVEVSECGIKFRLPKNHTFKFDQELEARIQFYDKEIFKCDGHIIRIENNLAVLLMDEGLPLQKIRTDHIFLINKAARLHN